MSNHKNSFASIGSGMGPSGMRSYVRIKCTGCDRIYEEVITASKRFNHTHLAKRARRMGWDIPSQDTPSHILCPICVVDRRSSRKTDPEELIRQYKFSEDKTSMSSAALPKPPQEPNKPREPTHDERVKIRRLLDTNFDDKTGSYLSGYSDQRIGLELNVPWAVVAKIREYAYGPIKIDPEIESLNASVLAVNVECSKLMDKASILMKQVADLTAQAKALRDR